ALMRNYLLRAQRNLGALLGGNLKRLVERGGENRLRAAEHRCHRLDRDPRNVVVGLRGGERRPAAYHAEAEQAALRIGRAVALLHQARPDAPPRAKFAHLLKETRVDIEK